MADLNRSSLFYNSQGTIAALLSIEAKNLVTTLFRHFLDEIFNHDAEQIEYFQRVIGYCLTGDVSEQKLWIHHGTGANGKSTLIRVLGKLFGDYSLTVPPETLMVRQGTTIPNDVARLRGARIVFTSETEDGARLAEGLVKTMTGGERIAARFLYREWFEFEATHKMHVVTNHKPRVFGTDHAIWRRLVLIPYEVRIEEKDQDKMLLEKLLNELPGILNFAIAGCFAWQKFGLKEPRIITEATKEYKDDMDLVGKWMDECCVEEEGAEGRAQELYKNYKDWAEENGEWEMPHRKFSLILREKGFKRRKDRRGNFYVGITLKDEGGEDDGIEV